MDQAAQDEEHHADTVQQKAAFRSNWAGFSFTALKKPSCAMAAKDRQYLLHSQLGPTGGLLSHGRLRWEFEEERGEVRGPGRAAHRETVRAVVVGGVDQDLAR